MLTILIVLASLSSPHPLDTFQSRAHVVAMAADPGTTGATVTDAQITQVRDFEQARADADAAEIAADQVIIDDVNSTPERVAAAQADQDTASTDQGEARGDVNICTKALNGNPKDRSKASVLYNVLVIADMIPGA